jgi:hypothetical protein
MSAGYFPDSNEFLTVEDALRVITRCTDHPTRGRTRAYTDPTYIAPRFSREQNEQALRDAYETGTVTLQDEESMRVGNPSKHLESTHRRVMAKIKAGPLAAAAMTLWISFADFKRFGEPRVTYTFLREELVADEKIRFYDVENELGYTIQGAARALATKYPISESAMARRIFDAAEQGKLEVRDPRTGMPYIPQERSSRHERISVSELDRWLEESGVLYRLGEDSVSSGTATVATHPPGVDRNDVMRIFRVKLRDLDNKKFWNRVLGDVPIWLQKALITTGRPGVSSRWDVLGVAHALLDHRDHLMNLQQLNKAIETHDPELYEQWKVETAEER